ncbi:MAG TPA: SDR family oxidoreductase [Noviherbaspirillum sp.]|jgi:NAD(P)-dependent dehydrogenase (short-subunit alcohol dehydrogenase family)|uniref:SDR family oxidoreductase n=1 Tax=Noviherbaspirillum sp. TaxID=1926288 RepID=UPI002DDD8C70|nr:SDR family oxidoreductase [Noviherbaspirillum sp.]HEV2612100.1 SDR family oxidoreductase [Noviherbaspirillum sp.]
MQKVALITAASRGIGAACARELAARGYKLVLMSRSEQIHDLAKELGGAAFQGSSDNEDDLQTLVSLAMASYGRIDAVINNTGHPKKGPLLELSDEDWHDGLDLLLLNVVRMMRLTTPVMQAHGGGAIVNISTFAAFEPSARFPISATLRAALGAFTKIYADQVAASNIRINNLLPGYVESIAQDAATIAQIPMGRQATTAEIARTAAFLLSDDAGYITGQNIRVDGGLTRSV